MTGEKNMENLKIGKKISEYRRVNNLTIKEFSELTNLSSALLSQLERGMGNPSLSALQSISSALNMSLDRKSTRLNSSHITRSRMPSSA